MHNQLTLKKKIREKFGTIRWFSKAVNIPESDLRHYFSGKMSEESAKKIEVIIKSKLKTTGSKKIENPDIITEEEREMVRIGILLRFFSLRDFCLHNPDFSISFVSNVITGRRIRKDKRFKSLVLVIQKVNLKGKPSKGKIKKAA